MSESLPAPADIASQTMRSVGKHSGEPVEDQAAAVAAARRRLLLLALGVTATLIAWGFLVFAAIEFGGKARDGESEGWIFLGFATLGATACLFETLLLAGKILETLRGQAPPPRQPGARRASR